MSRVRLLLVVKCISLHRKHASISLFLNNLLRHTKDMPHHGPYTDCRGISAPASPSPTLAFAVVSLTSSHSFLLLQLHRGYCPLWNLLSQSCCLCWCWTQPCPSWSQPALDIREASGSFTEATPVAPSTITALSCKSNTKGSEQPFGILKHLISGVILTEMFKCVTDICACW